MTNINQLQRPLDSLNGSTTLNSHIREHSPMRVKLDHNKTWSRACKIWPRDCHSHSTWDPSRHYPNICKPRKNYKLSSIMLMCKIYRCEQICVKGSPRMRKCLLLNFLTPFMVSIVTYYLELWWAIYATLKCEFLPSKCFYGLYCLTMYMLVKNEISYQ